MKKTILASSVALGLVVTGVAADQNVEAGSINKEELAYTAQNNPEKLNAAPIHEGEYDYNFDLNSYNYDFASDGTYYSWAYTSEGTASSSNYAPSVEEVENNYNYENVETNYTEEVQTQQAAPAVEEVEVQETQEVSEPAASTPAQTTSSSSSNSGLNWDGLAACESGGDASVVSSNGLYHGLYQFDAQTWQSVGGSGVASDASAAEQTERAQMLYDQRGSQPWPVCGANL